MSKKSPVYVVQPEDGHGQQCPLPFILLYPCNDLPVNDSIDFESCSRPAYNFIDTPVQQNELEREPNHDQATPVANDRDEDNLLQPSNAPKTDWKKEPPSNSTFSSEAKPFPRPQKPSYHPHA